MLGFTKCGPTCGRPQMMWGVLCWVSTRESTNKEGRAGGSALLWLSCIQMAFLGGQKYYLFLQ